MLRIDNGYPIESEADFQAVLFGEIYKILPAAIISFEKKLKQDYQSYMEIGKNPTKRKSRIDIYIENNGKITAIEVKYFKGAGKAVEADMLADIAKLEKVVEAKEAHEGFCIQLVKPGVLKRLPTGHIEVGQYKPNISGWNYDFEIKGQYHISPTIAPSNYATIVHYIREST